MKLSSSDRFTELERIFPGSSQKQDFENRASAHTELLEERNKALEKALQALDEGQREFSQALTLGRACIFTWDIGGNDTCWTEDLLALYGLDSGAPGGPRRNWLDCIVPEDWEATRGAIERSLDTGEFNHDFRIRRFDDGEIHWLSARARVIFDTAGHPERLTGILIDVTERKRAQADIEDSRLRLTAILDSLNEGVIVSDLEGKVLNMNPAALRMHGFTDVAEGLRRLPEFADQFEMRSLTGRVLPLDEWPLARALRGESFVDCELEVDRKDNGEKRVFAYNGTPVAGSDGKVILAVLTLRDIKERKRAEQALLESERRLALALKVSGTAAWELDVATQKLLSADELLFTMLGYSPWEITTLSDWLALVHPDYEAAVAGLIDNIITGKQESYLIELCQLTKDGHWHWILCQAIAAERDAEGRAIRLIGAHTDIDERKATESEIQRLNTELEERVKERTAELERANEKLMHSNLELQHFAHATAHDLQTPLRSIAGFTQLLRQKVGARGDPELDNWAGQVVDNTKRLQELIQALLSYTGLDAQGLPFEEVDMDRLVGEVLASLHSLISHTGTEVLRKPLPKVCADRTQISQLLQNLVENGIKYNQSKPPRITIAAELQGEGWIFSVADNGIGIDPRHHERIFEIFRRLHTYTQVPGSGIGLALCRRIVERHGGRIWVESRPGEGSAFYFSLPVRR